jgi:SAM-dependent methyltransferase
VGLPLIKAANRLIRRVSSASHRLQYHLEWLPPSPEWFDHYVDVHWQWSATGQSFFVERGVFSSLAIEQGASVLELCCGDGFNAKHFYGPRASCVVAVDFDPTAIAFARRANRRVNVKFEIMDIRRQLPEGRFDNVIWDAAIEHFTEEEIDSILQGIRRCLSPGGVLTGYTILEGESGIRHIPQHEREFKNKEDLLSFFKPTFPFVEIFETVYPSRTNLYFYASDREESIPFADRHPRFLQFPAKETTGANQP